MKKLSLFFIAATIGAFLINSCSIERRYHRTGFNVNWNHTSVKVKKDKSKSDMTSIELKEEFEVTSKVEKNASTIAVISNELKENVSVNVPAENTSYSVLENVSDLAENNSNKIILHQKSKFQNNEVELVNSKNNLSSTITKKEALSHAKSIKKTSGSDTPIGLLYFLCIVIPFVAVGIATDWDVPKVLLNVLLCILCGIPGIIHAFIVVSNNR